MQGSSRDLMSHKDYENGQQLLNEVYQVCVFAILYLLNIS
jgi:hypothetical protein